ncbi:hypothetical protein BHM03_00053691, partial [Ensete ventricosum]
HVLTSFLCALSFYGDRRAGREATLRNSSAVCVSSTPDTSLRSPDLVRRIAGVRLPRPSVADSGGTSRTCGPSPIRSRISSTDPLPPSLSSHLPRRISSTPPDPQPSAPHPTVPTAPREGSRAAHAGTRSTGRR